MNVFLDNGQALKQCQTLDICLTIQVKKIDLVWHNFRSASNFIQCNTFLAPLGTYLLEILSGMLKKLPDKVSEKLSISRLDCCTLKHNLGLMVEFKCSKSGIILPSVKTLQPNQKVTR